MTVLVSEEKLKRFLGIYELVNREDSAEGIKEELKKLKRDNELIEFLRWSQKVNDILLLVYDNVAVEW